MEHGNGAHGNPLYSLISLEDFKALLGIDDRDDALSRYYLITATYTIEQYCKRRLLRRKNTDYLTFTGEYVFSLREYPVGKVLTVHAVTAGAALRREALFGPENLVDPKHHYCLPDEGIHKDIPSSLRRLRNGFFVSAATVAFHIKNIYRKFGIDGKNQERAAFVAKVLGQRTFSLRIDDRSVLHDQNPRMGDNKNPCSKS
jgi:hypothetical protein